MARFYWGLVQRLPDLLWSSASRLEKIVGVVTFSLSVFGMTLEWPFSPYWGLMPFGFFLLYGLLRANYEAFYEEIRGRQQLEARAASVEKRRAVKDLLGQRHREGKTLLGDPYVTEPDKHEAQAWGDRTYALIESALGVGEAELFYYNPRRLSLESATTGVEVEVWVEDRLDRLVSLIERVDALEPYPDFRPQDW